MAFFDFIRTLPAYATGPDMTDRMNWRHKFLISAYENDIKDASVLDLGANDGRWSYAFAGAGADRVTGIEARARLIAEFKHFPDPRLRARVDLRCQDIFEAIRSDIANGVTYDVIAVFGVFYHIMDHFGLLRLLRDLDPKLIIIDSEFIQRDNPVIQLVKERTDIDINAAPQIPNQKTAVVGIPTFRAMDVMAEALDYELEWADWTIVPQEHHWLAPEYFRPATGQRRRATVALRPRTTAA